MKRSKYCCVVLGLVLGVLALLAQSASATTYYWDTNGLAAGAGVTASGTWAANCTYCSTSSTGTVSISTRTTTSGDDLYFVAGPKADSGSSDYTVTVSGTQYAKGLYFQSSGCPTLGGTGTISLAGSSGITVLQYAYDTIAPGSVTISAPISLLGTQTWTNNSSSTLLTIAGNIANGANTLKIAGSGNTNISGVLGNGIGGLTKIDSGQLTLTNSNTFTGGTTISGGLLQLGDGTSGHDGVLSSAGGISNSAALCFNLYGSQTYTGTISGTGSLTKAGSGSLIFAGSNSYTGGTTISGGMLQFGNGTSGGDVAISGTGRITNNATLAMNTYGTRTYAGVINGSGNLVKSGAGTLILSATNRFSGTTTISSGTIRLTAGGALQGSTLISPTSSTVVFDSTAGSHAFTLGGLSGGGSIALQDTTATAIALTIGANNASTSYSGTISGTGSLTKTGLGTLILTGSNSCSSGVTVGAGVLTLASNGSLTTSGTANLCVGDKGPAAMTIQDSASVSVGGDLDVNVSNPAGTSSTLTLKSGSLSVTGQTKLGQAGARTDPSDISAAFYQSGGTATLTNLLTVGCNGATVSLYDINGGTLNANGGLVIADGTAGGGGTGVMTIRGSSTVNVSGGSGLVIGQDISRTTSGKLSLSGGSLTVTSIVLGNSGGIGTFIRNGGALSVTGNLTAGGVGTLILDDTLAPVQSTFGGLVRSGASSTLVIVPQNGHLFNSGNEQITFRSSPSSDQGIIGPWLVAQTSANDSSGTYLTTSGSGTAIAAATYSNTSGSHTTTLNELLNAAGTTTITDTGSHAWALRVGPYTATLTGTVTLGSGGIILNGGTVSGGTLTLSGTGPLIYTGSTTSTISSAIQSNAQLVKFGPGTLALSANNTLLSGGVAVRSGVLSVLNGGALGSITTTTTVAADASLEVIGGTGGLTVGNLLTLNGSGINDNGALRNVDGNNLLTGNITLNSSTAINVAGGTLTLGGQVTGLTCDLTKSGSGTLVFTGSSGTSFPASLTVADGAIRLQKSNAIGVGNTSVTANNATVVQLQGGIAIPSGAALTVIGTGTGNGALENVQGSNSWLGPVTLANDSLIGIDAAADTLTLGGNIDGGYALSKAGSGKLQLSGSSSFTGEVNVLDGTLMVSTANSAGSNGPLGAGTVPVVLGGSGKTATFQYAGATATSSRDFTLAANAVGNIQVDSSSSCLTLTGAISGNGSLMKTGPGTLALAGSNVYQGTTTVCGGILAVDTGGSINNTSGIVVVGGSLQVTAGNIPQLPDSGNFTLRYGSVNYVGSGTTSENVGALVLADHNTVVTTGSATSSLCFAGISHAPGGTISFSSTNSQIQFRAPPTLVGGIFGGYAFFNDSDFATCGTTAPYTVSAYTAYTTSDLANMNNATINAKPSSLTAFSSHNEINSLVLTSTGSATTVTMNGSGSLTLDSGGLIASSINTSVTISGGMLKGSVGGELVVNALHDLSISSIIADNGGATALVKTGSATLTLSGSNTYTGSTVVTNGTLQISGANALPCGNLTIDNEGCVSVNTELARAAQVVIDGKLLITTNGSMPGSSFTIRSPGSVVLDSSLTKAPRFSRFSFTNDDPDFYCANLSLSTEAGSLLNVQNAPSTVPEPGTLGLMVAGLVGAGIMAIRRRFGPSSKRPIGV